MCVLGLRDPAKASSDENMKPLKGFGECMDVQGIPAGLAGSLFDHARIKPRFFTIEAEGNASEFITKTRVVVKKLNRNKGSKTTVLYWREM